MWALEMSCEGGNRRGLAALIEDNRVTDTFSATEKVTIAMKQLRLKHTLNPLSRRDKNTYAGEIDSPAV